MGTENRAPTRDRILLRLKLRGPQTAARLAAWLGMTPMGARQHLTALKADGLVEFESVRRGVGRPARHWQLTAAGSAHFPQGYADLTVDILGAVRETFGPAGMDRLIAARNRKQLRLYQERVPASGPLARRVAALADLRQEEGYMAAWSRDRDGSFALVENHCPICAAAQFCQGLCAGELELFQEVLGDRVRVERVEHMLAGARRCAYRIRPAGKPAEWPVGKGRKSP